MLGAAADLAWIIWKVLIFLIFFLISFFFLFHLLGVYWSDLLLALFLFFILTVYFLLESCELDEGFFFFFLILFALACLQSENEVVF